MSTTSSLVRFFRVVTASLAIAGFLAATSAAYAQRNVPIVRDAEIEALVAEYAAPILQAAGLSGSGIEIVLVNDHNFNAFVAGRRIFIHTGALLAAETPNEIIGVIAHEAGHIAGGHQHRLREQIARAQTMAVVAALLGVGAGVAGAASDAGGLAQAGTGLALGGAEAARRSLMGYQRTEEATADRSALDYLEATGQSGRGMLKTFERMAGNLALSGVNVDPYQISHPMPRDRIANLQTLVEQSRYRDRADPPAVTLRHNLMRAKIAAYTAGPNAAPRLFRNDPRGLPMLYAEATSSFLNGNPRDALTKIDRLIAAQPGNSYFHELRGEILIKANQPREAANAYARAINLSPSPSGLLQVGYGQALLATGEPDLMRQAATQLKAGLSREPEYVNGYRFLAQAYGQTGDIGAAELASAEGNFHAGNYREAKIFAARAQMKLQRGSPDWLRAQDIIDYRATGER
ncbi:M48 family metalloprotease [Chelativorans alearense]|uniref:M48 family metalloprotease n=1 Tax=Chelativorans alearense TaxID=2681495 RepID=UPI0013D4E570|nr:M48 family metalloprotease [Chelativorans alearense]